jgi:GT2 family glycosyltransferase
MKLSISIVNWNTREILEKCLKALYESCFKDFEIFVIDNNSSDNSIDTVKNKFPQVNLIANTANLGFSKGNNQAIKISSGKYILVLNPDIIVSPDTLQKMIDFIEKDHDIGALGIKLLNENNIEDKSGYFRKYPSITQVILFYTILETISLKIKFIRNKYWERQNNNKISPIEQIPGACLLLRKEAINDVGFFDEDFCLFFEDVDLCYRISKSHWKIYFNPDITAIHKGAQSISMLSYTELATKFFTSMYIYFIKHHSFLKAKIAKNIIICNTLLKIIVFKSLYYLSDYKKEKRKEHIQMLYNLLINLWKI